MGAITLEQFEELITGKTPEEYQASFSALPQETQDGILKMVDDYIRLGEEDSPESFATFFLHMEGVELEEFALEAVRDAYKAHEEQLGLLAEWFREGAKTTVFTKNFLLYRIAKEPHQTNMIIRINDDKANETAKAIADAIEFSPKWKELYPNIVPDKVRGWSANGYFVKDTSMKPNAWKTLRNRAPDYPTLVGYGYNSTSIVGTRVSGVLSIDDIHDDVNTESDRELAHVKRRYFEVIVKCVMDGAWELLCFTPWQYNDLYADLRPNVRRFVHNKVPVMKPAPEGEGQYWEPDSDIPYSGKWYYLASPKRFPFERIAKIYLTRPEDADEYIMFAFERQYLLDMEATKGFNLKGEWLHQYPYESINETWPVFFGIDYASTPDKLKHKSRDYFGLGILRAIPGGGLVLIDGVRKHVSRPEALDIVMNLWQEYPTTSRIGVETIGKGEEFYTDLMLMTDVMGRSPPLMSIKHGRRSKGERFEGWLAPRFKNSQIWISDRPTPFLREFKNEWLGWPNAQHDDCLDGVYMAAQAAQYMMPSKAERTFQKKRKPSPWAALVNS